MGIFSAISPSPNHTFASIRKPMIPVSMTSTERALFQSLVHGPLLVGDLPEAVTFPYHQLAVPTGLEADRPGLNLNQKLGHLYESALAVLLEASPRYDLIAQNLQLQKDAHTTVGELDFLLRDLSDGRLVHLELATKFYLAVRTEAGLKLPGPDARDNYFRKIQRLREHQLVLADKHRDVLAEAYRDEPIVVRQLIYGCLFERISMHEPGGHAPATSAERDGGVSPQRLLEYLNPDCRRGRWLSVDQCRDYFSADTELRVIPKTLWPVPLDFLDGIPLERWAPPAQIDRCVMLRVNDETAPYFVAPAGYPEHRAHR